MRDCEDMCSNQIGYLDSPKNVGAAGLKWNSLGGRPGESLRRARSRRQKEDLDGVTLLSKPLKDIAPAEPSQLVDLLD